MTDDPPIEGDSAGHRSYEVYQRERVGESTALVKPRQLISDEYLADPYPVLAILREHYPCYRDWLGNRFWITRYDDVTSVFVDEANFETPSKRSRYGRPRLGRDLWGELDLLWCQANRIDAGLDAAVGRCVDGLRDQPDLALGLAARLALELWGEVLDLAAEDLRRFSILYWRMQRGAGWDPIAHQDGLAALDEATVWFDELIAERRAAGGGDLISTAARLDVDGGSVTGADIAATILESDHETLHGGLANMWFHLLTEPDRLKVVRHDGRLMKSAWLETLRHSPPVLSAPRHARHEIERFGRLIPAGALVVCSAAAANRDPWAFADPDCFRTDRDDLCQREPRGQYRADGLPSGIAFGLGRPSIHPAVPRDRPRSRYAITRDVAVAASRALLDAYPDLTLAPGARPILRALKLGEMHTCWSLPVTL